VTRVHLALVPVLPDRVVALCALGSFAEAVTLSATLRRGLDSTLALEVMFADGVALVCEHTGTPRPFTQAFPVYLLVETAGRQGSGDAQLAALNTLLGGDGGVLDSAVATDPGSRSRLWSYRHRHTEAIGAAGTPHKLDVTLPFDRLVEFER